MEEIRFESLTALYERLLPALNYKCNDLKMRNIIVSETDIWNFLKDTKWTNSKDISMASLVDDIFKVDDLELLKYIDKKGDKYDN